MWVYKKSEPNLWTVGFYSPDGGWHSDSDHPTPEKAAERVRWLNGGNPTEGHLENLEKTAKAAREFVEHVSLRAPSGSYQDGKGQDVCGGCGAYFITENPEADLYYDSLGISLALLKESS